MALTITAITPVYPAGCAHYRITVNHEGTSRTIQGVTREDIDGLEDVRAILGLGAPPALTALWLLVLLWVRYELAKGATLASLVGQQVAP